MEFLISHADMEDSRDYQCLISKKEEKPFYLSSEKSNIYIFSRAIFQLLEIIRKFLQLVSSNFGKGIDQCQTRTNFSIINPRSITLPGWKGDNYSGSRNRSKFPASFKRAWEVRGKSIGKPGPTAINRAAKVETRGGRDKNRFGSEPKPAPESNSSEARW